MLLWLEFCAEMVLVFEDLYGDLWFYQRENQHMEVCWVMLSLDVSQCAGDIGKTNVNTTHMCICYISKRIVFEAVAPGGAGNQLFTMNQFQKTSEVVMCSTVGFVTDLFNKGCDGLRTRF